MYGIRSSLVFINKEECDFGNTLSVTVRVAPKALRAGD